MKTKELVSKTETHVRGLFAEHIKPELVYHNIFHTESVVANAEKIAGNFDLSKRDHAALTVSCWFHDTGYLFTTPEGHEEKSAELAVRFLQDQECEADFIRDVNESILATKIPQHPTSVISQIVCDADLFHLGTSKFAEVNKRLKDESERISGQPISGQKWRKRSLELLENKTFHTEYARQVLESGKAENIAQTKEKIAGREAEKNAGEKNKEGKEKGEKKSRGVETMFRTTSSNHLKLSEMADAKANIMITVNSIIASILVSVLFRKLEEDERFLIPAMIFLVTSLVSIIFSILVTRPTITHGKFTKEEIDDKRANLLFFGNFHNMSLADYQAGIKVMMYDSEFLYGTMTRDIYFLGKVLAKKYRLLRIASNFFMIGFVLSIIAFVIAVTLFHK